MKKFISATMVIIGGVTVFAIIGTFAITFLGTMFKIAVPLFFTILSLASVGFLAVAVGWFLVWLVFIKKWDWL